MLLKSESIVTASPVLRRATAHPFLIVRRDDFPELQRRAEISPWKEQKAAALRESAETAYNPAARIDVKAIVLARIFSTAALSYILDPENRREHVDHIVEHLRLFDRANRDSITAEMVANPDPMLWRFGVPTGNAFFQAVLALDIIYDDLSPAVRIEIEAILREGPARYFRETALAWKQGSLAAAAIWPLYAGDIETYTPIVHRWREDVLASVTEDGVFSGGMGYADARWSFLDREHKALFGEVLAHAGVLPHWYAEPRLGNFHEWLNGYAYTPFRVLWSFGDCGVERFNAEHQSGNERAYRYSARAGRYASWLRDGKIAPPGLGSYILANQPPATPLAPPSRVFADGGAWLKETTLNPKSLAAVLWNTRHNKDAHAHKETNSMGLAAYGEHLLRAGGYNGWETPEKGFSWTYIHDRAIAGNIALFNYEIPRDIEEEQTPSGNNDHVLKCGAGITSSLITGYVDYARGDSGVALPNGRHLRNLLFVHPADGASGYYAVIDELSAAAGSVGHIVWHPASNRFEETVSENEYNWLSNEFSGSDVGLSIFLVTPPIHTKLRNGILANWDHGIVGKYLVADYATDRDGRKAVVTVLFPHDAKHAKAAFERIKLDGGSGAVVRQRTVSDLHFKADHGGIVHLGADVSAQAVAGCIRRLNETEIADVWLMDATHFCCREYSLASVEPLIVHRRRDVIRVKASRGTRFTLKQPGLRRVHVNGKFQIATPDITLDLPEGEHVLNLE